MPMIVPAVNGVRATEAPWFFGLAYPSPGRGRTRPGESAGAYHVFKSGREPQPSGKRVDGLAVQQPSARRVGALLELEGDTHRLGLFHTGQHPNRDSGSRHGSTVVFRPPRRARSLLS
jgi:hypothetical protein